MIRISSAMSVMRMTIITAMIEIRTLDELARLRDDLNGDGTDDGNIDEITAVGSAGCPQSGCVGYELTVR